MLMSPTQIAALVETLRLLNNRVCVHVGTAEVSDAANILAAAFPDAVRISFGDGSASRQITPDTQQTIIAEVYSDVGSTAPTEFYKSVFTNDENIDHPHSNTAVIIIHDKLPKPLVNRCITVQLTPEA